MIKQNKLKIVDDKNNVMYDKEIKEEAKKVRKASEITEKSNKKQVQINCEDEDDTL